MSLGHPNRTPDHAPQGTAARKNGQPRVLAFIAPQTVTGHETLAQFLTSVREVEKQTGLDFYPDLPRELQDRMETVKVERLW